MGNKILGVAFSASALRGPPLTRMHTNKRFSTAVRRVVFVVVVFVVAVVVGVVVVIVMIFLIIPTVRNSLWRIEK